MCIECTDHKALKMAKYQVENNSLSESWKPLKTARLQKYRKTNKNYAHSAGDLPQACNFGGQTQLCFIDIELTNNKMDKKFSASCGYLQFTIHEAFLLFSGELVLLSKLMPCSHRGHLFEVHTFLTCDLTG